MAYGLPSPGERNWHTELNDSMAYLKEVAEAAQSAAGLDAAVAATVGNLGTATGAALAGEFAPASAIEDSGWKLIGAVGEPGFQNGWVNFGAGEEPAAYRKINGVVHIRGIIKSGTVGLATAAFTLPEGYRPGSIGGSTTGPIFPAISNDAFARITVLQNGGVCMSVGSPAWFALNNISFVAS